MMKRAGFVCFLTVVALVGAMLRVFWLSAGDNASAAQTAVSKRCKAISLYNSKGIIYDRNLDPIAGKQPCIYLLVNPRNFDRESMDEFANVTGVDLDYLQNNLKRESPFVLETVDYEASFEGVTAIDGYGRYSGISSHLLGYLDSDGIIGLSGIEKEFDAFLSLFSSEKTIVYTADAIQGAVEGLGYRVDGSETSDNGIILSLDRGLSECLKKSMISNMKVGSGIVMDCVTGEILAMESLPNYSEKNIIDYIESDRGELINRGLYPQTVGSVFKIIIAAAALEAGLEHYRYECNGGIFVGDRFFSCHDKNGHGNIGIKEGFALSCNSYFIALGQLIGYDRIFEIARRFGFGESVQITESIHSLKGNVPMERNTVALANLCIGQGELTASPIHIARMTAVISNGGIMPEVQLLKGLYLNNDTKEISNQPEEKRILSEDHANAIKEYCEYSVTAGTGKNAKPEHGTAGGKTSSAQTGIYQNGKEQLNVYFTGFYPADSPRYVVTVFAEDGVSGGTTCGPVFRDVCNYLYLSN